MSAAINVFSSIYGPLTFSTKTTSKTLWPSAYSQMQFLTSGGRRSSGVSELALILHCVSDLRPNNGEASNTYAARCSPDLRLTSSKPFLNRRSERASERDFTTPAHTAPTKAALFFRVGRRDVRFGAIVLASVRCSGKSKKSCNERR